MQRPCAVPVHPLGGGALRGVDVRHVDGVAEARDGDVVRGAHLAALAPLVEHARAVGGRVQGDAARAGGAAHGEERGALGGHAEGAAHAGVGDDGGAGDAVVLAGLGRDGGGAHAGEAGAEAVDALVLAVGHAQHVLVLEQRETVNHVPIAVWMRERKII